MVNKSIKNKKNGFTLAEMLVSMLIVSVFFVAATKIITHKPPKEVHTPPHGFFECYYKGGELYVHTLRGKSEEEEYRAPNCNFQPPLGLSFINVHYIDNDENYFNSQEPLYDQKLELDEPSDIEQYYAQYYDGGTLTDRFDEISDDFLKYLSKVHPLSEILRQWNEEGEWPANVLFISW